MGPMKISGLFAIVFALCAFDSPIASPGSKGSCEKTDEMRGTLHLGEHGYFERDACDQIFALSFRSTSDEEYQKVERAFNKIWDSGSGDVRLVVTGRLSKEKNRLGRKVYYVESLDLIPNPGAG